MRLRPAVSQRHITPSSAWFCIEVWRAVACILAATPDALAIPLRELVPPKGGTPAFALVTDAGRRGWHSNISRRHQ